MNARFLQAKAWIDNHRRTLLYTDAGTLAIIMYFGLTMGPANAGPIKADCHAAGILKPITDWIAGNILGLASLGKPLLVILLVGSLILVFTKLGPKLLRYVGIVIGLILLIGIVQNIWGFIPGTVNC